MPIWARWILVLPVAVVAFLLSQLIGALASETWPISERAQDLLSQAFNSGLGPWALVRAGTATAPNLYRVPTAIALAALAALFIAMFLGATLMGNLKTEHSSGWMAVTSLIAFAALALAVVQVKEDQKKRVEV